MDHWISGPNLLEPSLEVSLHPTLNWIKLPRQVIQLFLFYCVSYYARVLFSSMPCFEQIFADQNEDSELRINAYLALMGCPDEATVDLVKVLLEREEVNQG